MAEYCKNPQIHAYKGGKKEFSITEGVGILEITKMTLSSNNEYAIIVNEIPEYRISVLDLASRTVFKGDKSSLPLRTEENTSLQESWDFLIKFCSTLPIPRSSLCYTMTS